MRFHRRDPAPVRITDASPGLSEDIRHRQRRYALTMGIRTLCVILAVVLWQVNRIAAVIALVAGGILPYIAVVVANAGHERVSEPLDARVTPRTDRSLGEPGPDRPPWDDGTDQSPGGDDEPGGDPPPR